jgi:hypothetical protein
VPKKVKTQRAPTQVELIARALDNEEGNIVEHRNYLQLEEEKRKRAQVVRPSIHGPVLRWISKAEEETVTIGLPPPAWPTYLHPPIPGYSSSTYIPNTGAVQSSGPTASQPSGHFMPQVPIQTSLAPTMIVSASGQPPTQTLPTPPPPSYVQKTEKVARNYVLHELAQYEGVPRPPWADTMESMFGDHVSWDELRVYVGKGRPFGKYFHVILSYPLSLRPSARRKQICPLTGLPARYLDPRTGVPFANIRAYQILTGILDHEYIWSETLGCYIGSEGSRHAQGMTGNTMSSSSENAMDVHCT